MKDLANVVLLTIFIVREVVFRVVPPALATLVVSWIFPAPVREKKIPGIKVGRHTLLGEVPAIDIVVFAMLAAVWHFTIAAHPGWRAGWYTE